MVSNMTEYIFGAIGVILLLGVLFEAYRYLKGHPQALANLEARVKAAEVKAQGLSSDVVSAIHSKLDTITAKVDATHAAALAPVTVTMIPATPPQETRTVQIPVAGSSQVGAPAIVPTGLPPLGPVGPDGKPTVAFPGGDLATFQAFTARAIGQYGYGITIVNTSGQPLDVRGQPPVAPDASGANSDQPFGSPRTDFTMLYQNGRNHFLPGVPQTLTITAPATPTGRLKLQFSGRGGSPGAPGVITDASANVAVTVINSTGQVVATGMLDTAWLAPNAGDKFTAILISDKETQQDITLQVSA